MTDEKLNIKKRVQKRLLLFLYKNKDFIDVVEINPIFMDCDLGLLDMRKIVLELGHKGIIQKADNHADWGTSVAGSGHYNLNNAILSTRLTTDGVLFVEEHYKWWGNKYTKFIIELWLPILAIIISIALALYSSNDDDKQKQLYLQVNRLDSMQLFLQATDSLHASDISHIDTYLDSLTKRIDRLDNTNNPPK